MGAVLHFYTALQEPVKVVSVPSRGFSSFLLIKSYMLSHSIACFRPLSRYWWVPTITTWKLGLVSIGSFRPLSRYGWITTNGKGVYLMLEPSVSGLSRGFGGILLNGNVLRSLRRKVSGPSRGLGSFLHMSYTTDDPWPERFPPPLEAWVVSYLVSAGCLIVKGLSFRPLAKYGWGPTKRGK